MLTHIFDTHAHYDDEQFNADRHELLASLPAKGICGIVNAACDMQSAAESVALCDQYDFLWCAVGIHPHAADKFQPSDRKTLADYAKHPKVVAIGETGLDYHYDFSPRDVQREVFKAHIELALDLDLPVIVHDREAHGDTLALLRKYKPRGILHCFSGSAEMVREIARLGMYIGFGGAITFKNASKILRAAAAVPDDLLLLETDCPYMAPEPFRGRRCDSSHIAYTAQALAALRGTQPQALLDLTWKNAKTIYRIYQ